MAAEDRAQSDLLLLLLLLTDEDAGVGETEQVASGRGGEKSDEGEIFEEKSGRQVSHRHCKVPEAGYHQDP